MTRTLVLDESGIENLKALLEYSLDDEVDDYKAQIAEGNPVDCHILVSIVDLWNRLNGTNLDPSDFAAAPEEPSQDDTVHCCPECETPNQFGELCHRCRSEENAAAEWRDGV